MLGAVAGGITGFLIRPAALSGEKLPFYAVLSHGSSPALLDNVFNQLARDSFNVMAACTVIGLIIGMVAGYFVKSKNIREGA